MGRGRTLVAAVLCGAFVVALCGSAHAGVAALSGSTRTAARMRSVADRLTPSVTATSDPVSSVDNTVGGLVDKATDTVAGSASAVTRPDPERVVKKVVRTVRRVVDRVLPQPETGTDPVVGQETQKTAHNAPADRRRHRDRHSAIDHRATGSTRFHVSTPLTFTSGAHAQAADAATSHRSSSGLLNRLGTAAKEIAFPALLALLVIAFLVAQDRIDKSDPKLIALTPEQDADLVVFE